VSNGNDIMVVTRVLLTSRPGLTIQCPVNSLPCWSTYSPLLAALPIVHAEPSCFGFSSPNTP
jgi:hypothetical protein